MDKILLEFRLLSTLLVLQKSFISFDRIKIINLRFWGVVGFIIFVFGAVKCRFYKGSDL